MFHTARHTNSFAGHPRYGHVDAAFKENMTKEEAQQFVRKAISHAMARDGSSGGVIRMVVIDKTGVSVMPILYNRVSKSRVRPVVSNLSA